MSRAPEFVFVSQNKLNFAALPGVHKPMNIVGILDGTRQIYDSCLVDNVVKKLSKIPETQVSVCLCTVYLLEGGGRGEFPCYCQLPTLYVCVCGGGRET